MSGPDDRYWMAQALALGALAEGRTSPNPRVGCLIVRDGRVVGRGYHRAPGLPHAEAVAVADAGPGARGSTLYVNLEPCAHHGRTPPCVDLLVERGIGRVVAAMQDPDPRVNGKGFEHLRRAGIRVEVGLLQDEARRLNAAFDHWHRHRMPLVTLKAALSLDGQLAADGGRARWITGPAARRFAHRLRLAHDAVLVGAGTVRRDDPRLTVRLAGAGPSPLRVVLSAGLDLDPGCRLFRVAAPSRPRIYTTAGAPEQVVKRLTEVADIVCVEERDGALDLRAVLADLAGHGVQSLLVEGGGRTHAGFLEAGLAESAALFVSGKLLGARGGTPLLDMRTVDEPDRGWRFVRERLVPLGQDMLLMGALERGRECSPD
jgi:diaminohydroxyphosphoribosylaminopyrimidine deaminase/5-amino-6-(5-phosphoribosylamino)uracil reductase